MPKRTPQSIITQKFGSPSSPFFWWAARWGPVTPSGRHLSQHRLWRRANRCPPIEAKPETPPLTTAARPAAAREEAKAAVVESTPPETPKAAAPVSAKTQPVTPATVAACPPAPVQTPPYLIQLVSVKSNAAASWEWTRLQKHFAGLEPFIQKTVIKKRSTFNRLWADGFSSKRQAAACRSLKAKGQSCLVVKR